MANRVYINKRDVIEIIVDGDQTFASVQRMGEEALALCRQQRQQRKQAFILDNLLSIGSVPPEARALVVELVKSMEYDKLAMVGSGTLLRLGANLMLQATGKGSRVQYFDEYEKAMRWLKELP